MAQALDTYEHALLQIVAKGQGTYGWHAIGVQLSMLDVPRQRDMLAVLKDLAARGLLSRTLEADQRDSWSLTAAGQAQLDAALPEPLSQLSALLRKPDLTERVQGLLPYLEAPERYVGMLRALLEHGPGHERDVAFAATVLPEAERIGFVFELAQHPSADVRRAMLGMWAPQRFMRQGARHRHLPEPHWERLLRGALSDADDKLRAMAAGIAFDTNMGQALSAELIANANHSDPEVARTSLLALGSASDAESLRALRRGVSAPDALTAGCAVRGLAAWRDGRSNLWAALREPRQAVRQEALFALRVVVDDLDEHERQRLSTAPEDDVREAYLGYLSRHEERQ